MRKEFDLSGTRQSAVSKEPGKRRTTILLDTEVLAAFRKRAASTGRGYQTLINQALRDSLTADELAVKKNKCPVAAVDAASGRLPARRS